MLEYVRNHYLKIAGWVSAILGSLSGIKFVLDNVGRIEAAGSLIRLGQSVADYLTNLHPLTYLALLGAGILMIWWDNKRSRSAASDLNAPRTTTLPALTGTVVDGPFEWRDLDHILPGMRWGDGPIYIAKIYICGTYRGASPMVIEDVAVTSRVTAQRLRMQIDAGPANYVFAEELNPVPPNAPLTFQALFYDPTDTTRDGKREGLLAKDVIAKWGGFTFEIKYAVDGNRTTYSRLFDYEAISNMLMPPKEPEPLPAVTKKGT